MKNYVKTTMIFILATLATSCEDVIELDVPVGSPRLIIEASLDWEKGTLGNEQTIKLSRSTPYFDTNSITGVVGAMVSVKNETDGSEFIFEDQHNGLYTTSVFVPVLNQSYTLEVIADGEVYSAHEALTPVADIQEVSQSLEGGYDDQALDVNVFFNDPGNEANFYLIKFKEKGDAYPTLFDIKDEFTDGNQMSVFFEKSNNPETNEEQFESGDEVEIGLYGISPQYYNYVHKLVEQIEFGGGPLSATPAQIKGNCTNQSNPENFAYGYFRMTEVVKKTYKFQ